MKKLPDKTVERLSQYRRSLLNCLANGKKYIFSHEIANLHHITSVQVRRDIMLIGYTGTLRKGYDVKELADLIGDIIDSESGQNLAIIGLGNLGRALVTYLSGKRSKLIIKASFDINPEKVDRVYGGVPCYHIDKLEEIIQSENITIGIITTPAEETQNISEMLVKAGIKGILNYTPKSINVPDHVYLEEHDMITSIEKVAFFVKKNSATH
ncbi:MAG TPA: redox-sensing transcriptional repressor Rex [Bacteroidales bacterium]|nr:redox-sensing transcriptional repressor Rex [Bacteroidales bacterium]